MSKTTDKPCAVCGCEGCFAYREMAALGEYRRTWYCKLHIPDHFGIQRGLTAEIERVFADVLKNETSVVVGGNPEANPFG